MTLLSTNSVEARRDWQRLTDLESPNLSVYRPTEVLVVDDAENDGYDIGLLEDRPIWTTQGVETETFVSWRIDGWRFSREDPSLA